MSIFILVVKDGELSVPGDNHRCSNYGYNVRHGPFNTYAKYHCSKLGHAVVMTIWNIDAWQRQKYISLAVSCYFVSLLDKVSYLLDSIILLSQIIATMISTAKFERNNLPFTIENILKAEINWNMYEITPPCYVINNFYSPCTLLNNAFPIHILDILDGHLKGLITCDMNACIFLGQDSLTCENSFDWQQFKSFGDVFNLSNHLIFCLL